MTRILAHRIEHDGVCYSLSVAEFSDDFSSLRIYPFSEEIANTAWVDGTVEIIFADGKYSWHVIEPSRLNEDKK